MSEPKTPDETCEPIEIGHVVDDYDNMAVIYINDGHVEIPIYDDDTEPGKDGKIPTCAGADALARERPQPSQLARPRPDAHRQPRHRAPVETPGCALIPGSPAGRGVRRPTPVPEPATRPGWPSTSRPGHISDLMQLVHDRAELAARGRRRGGKPVVVQNAGHRFGGGGFDRPQVPQPHQRQRGPNRQHTRTRRIVRMRLIWRRIGQIRTIVRIWRHRHRLQDPTSVCRFARERTSPQGGISRA